VQLSVILEGFGVLIKEGVIDIRPIALLSSGLIRSLWNKFEPVKDGARRELGWSRLFIEFEYLYNELIKFHKENPDVPM
jgi:hypothetical protein